MKKKILIIFALIAALTACVIAGCSLNKKSMKIEYTYYKNGEVFSRESEDTLMIKEGGIGITMDVELELEGEKVLFEVYDYKGELAWNGEYTEDASFRIVLDDVPSGSRYKLKVKAENITRAHIIITSNQMKVQTPFD
ncbi:MAG: hypothetical protein K2G38_06230 [Clostridia bacterium]|nr:hypothetical protein [Clostridia bacterium]